MNPELNVSMHFLNDLENDLKSMNLSLISKIYVKIMFMTMGSKKTF